MFSQDKRQNDNDVTTKTNKIARVMKNLTRMTPKNNTAKGYNKSWKTLFSEQQEKWSQQVHKVFESNAVYGNETKKKHYFPLSPLSSKMLPRFFQLLLKKNGFQKKNRNGQQFLQKETTKMYPPPSKLPMQC